MKKLLAALALCYASSSGAVLHNGLGGETLTFDGNGLFALIHSRGTGPGINGQQFVDWYNFQFNPVPLPGILTGTASAFWINPSQPFPDLTLTGFKLYAGIGGDMIADTLIATGSDTCTGMSCTPGIVYLTGGSLNNGTDYYLEVAGTLTANPGPNNFGAYTISGRVAAIPEPSEWALMLSGLGLMGFVARRRRIANQAA